MLRNIIFVFALLCVVNCQWSDSSWTDVLEGGGFGGTLYLCFEGNNVHGMYSEYGLVQGNVNGDVITGQWYEGGGEDCVYGNFRWELSNDGNSFSGFWTCIEDDNEEFTWDESRIGGATTVNNLSCAVLANSGTVDGEWGTDTEPFYICVDDDEYESSYDFVEFTGYESGIVLDNERIASGLWIDQSGRGLSLSFVLADGTLGNVWSVDNDGEADTIDFDENTHNYDLYSLNGNASNSECASNRNLDVDSSSSKTSNTSNTSNSESSSNAVKLCFSALLVAFLVFCC